MMPEELDGLARVPVEIDVQLKTSEMTLQDLLNLEEGSVLCTRRAAGDDLDIIVGGCLSAFGEIVAAGSARGIRITDLLP